MKQITTPLPRLTLVLGGARSGKSRFAERLIEETPAPWTYIATAEVGDEEMRARIADHRSRRGDGWVTIETPLALATALRQRTPGPLLVDCLTLWLSNVMLAGGAAEKETDVLCGALADAAGPIVLISNEVGLSIVPETRLARDFRDAQGVLNQRVAEIADHVVFVAAGLPLVLKAPT